MDVITIFSEGQERIIKAILEGESLTQIMMEPSPICAILETDIIFGKTIGKGMHGEVLQVSFPGSGIGKYAVKRADAMAARFTKGQNPTTFLDLQKRYNIKAEKIIRYNNLKAQPGDVVPRQIWIPSFMTGCKLNKSISYTRFDSTKDTSATGVAVTPAKFWGTTDSTTFNEGDHLCPMNVSEFAISILAGSLYRSGRSINFLDVFYFATCKDPIITEGSIVNQYTFMERVRTSLRKCLLCLCERNYKGEVGIMFSTRPEAVEKLMNSITIQILHAIYLYQSTYQIVHGDLHDDNVFIDFLIDGNSSQSLEEGSIRSLEWKNQRLIDADYYEYRIDGKSIYVPGGKECPFIVKIGDWGLACKYSSPQIANVETIISGYDQYDGNGPWIPNFYNEMYDMYYIIDILYRLNPSNVFISNIMSWMLDVPPGIPDAIAGTSIIGQMHRPMMSKISMSRFSHVSPKNLLLEDTIMSEFYKVPPAGSKIILLGE